MGIGKKGAAKGKWDEGRGKGRLEGKLRVFFNRRLCDS